MGGVFDGEKCSKSIEWLTAFAEDHPDYPVKKDYSSNKAKATRQKEDFEICGVRANPLIYDSTYLVAFLSCWLCTYVKVIFSTTVRPKTFLMAAEMSKGTRYSLAVPKWALLYEVLGYFCAFQ